jgi:uncharacterized protein
MRFGLQVYLFIFGLCIFSYGIAMAIQVKYLGASPWDVLNIALYEQYGFSIGTWNIIIGILLISATTFIGRKHINVGTFLNAVLVGLMVDAFLYFNMLPNASGLMLDLFILVAAILLMGIGGGMYSAAGIGLGPRDGIMLSISDHTGMSISKIRIIMECIVLTIALLIGGPVFIFTFIYTFIQSPVYQQSYLFFKKVLAHFTHPLEEKKKVVH